MSLTIVQLVLKQNLERLLSPIYPYFRYVPSTLFYSSRQLQTNPVAYFVKSELDYHRQIYPHQQARYQTCPALVLLKIRLNLSFTWSAATVRFRVTVKKLRSQSETELKIINWKLCLSIVSILFLRMKFQLHLNRFWILKINLILLKGLTARWPT